MNQSPAVSNYNEKREKFYGIHKANHFPELYDEIISAGTNLSYIEAKKELVATLAVQMIQRGGQILKTMNTPPLADHEVKYLRVFREVLEEVGVADVECITDYLEDIRGLMDRAVLSGTGRVMHEFVEEFEEHFADALDIEEAEYEYIDEQQNLTLHLKYLGGAAHIWVIDSSYITEARECSPCVPGGGDLDSTTRDTEGFDFLCLPPGEYDGIGDTDFMPYTIRMIDEKGHESGMLWKRNGRKFDAYREPSIRLAHQLDQKLQDALGLLDKYRYQVQLQGDRNFDLERLDKADGKLRKVIRLVETVQDGEVPAGSESLKVEQA